LPHSLPTRRPSDLKGAFGIGGGAIVSVRGRWVGPAPAGAAQNRTLRTLRTLRAPRPAVGPNPIGSDPAGPNPAAGRPPRSGTERATGGEGDADLLLLAV